MAGFRIPGVEQGNPGFCAPRTPGMLGYCDQGDIDRWSVMGATPGPVGVNDPGQPDQAGQLAAAQATVTPLPAQAAAEPAPWMAHAIAQAQRFKGQTEDQIEKVTNYAKEVVTGQNTLVGEKHPWCAAFVNWCLMKANIPIENPGYPDRTAAKGRAHGFYQVQGPKLKPKDASGPIITNPLFKEVDEPVYGAIAMVTSASGHGHHVGFVLAKSRPNFVLLLGGNQSNKITVIEANIQAKDPDTINARGKTIQGRKYPDHLRFFLPASYTEVPARDTLPEESMADAVKRLDLGTSDSRGSTR